MEITEHAPPAHESGISEAAHRTILEHYERVAPLLVGTFGAIPIVAATFPSGFDAPPNWHGAVAGPLPASIPHVDVVTASGSHRYVGLAQNSLLWLIHRYYAVEFHSWSPIAADPTRVRFARILLERDNVTDERAVQAAAFALRDVLARAGAKSIPMHAGATGIALWIPFADAPPYPPVLAWLHAVAAQAVAQNANLLSSEPNSHASGRVHLHVGSNAPGRYSALPYSLRGDDDLCVCAPLRWNEIDAIEPGSITAHSFTERFEKVGDVFATQLKQMSEQAFAAMRRPQAQAQTHNAERYMTAAHAKSIEPHGHILRGALAILQDGKPRSAEELLQEGLKRNLFPPGTSEKYVYTSLLEYIVRTGGHGHRPLFLQGIDRRFRLNVPLDPWPDVAPQPQAAPSETTQALIDRLAQTAHGDDPAAFELAVCDAFAHLGFVATHLGGHQAPDGYADAPLGVLGYRLMLECKTAGVADVSNPDALEACKYRDAYGAQYCAIIGPSFSESIEFTSELKTHGVSAWTVEDLQHLLAMQSSPREMLALLQPGFVSDVLPLVRWNRDHDVRKRVRLVSDYLREAGWAAQIAAAKQGSPQNAPRLTEDAAMLLVDQRLAAEGAAAACERGEVQAAFAYLTSPLVNDAVWIDEHARDAIVITAPPPPLSF